MHFLLHFPYDYFTETAGIVFGPLWRILYMLMYFIATYTPVSGRFNCDACARKWTKLKSLYAIYDLMENRLNKKYYQSDKNTLNK